MSEQTDLIAGAYDAFARGDVPGVLDRLDPSIHWHVAEVLPHGGDFDGRDGVGAFFAGIAERWEDLVVRTNPPVAGNGTVIVTGRGSGHLRGGEAAGYGFAHVWTVSDGRATRFDEYVDPDEMPQ